MKKGQNFRLFVNMKCVAGAKSCTIEETAELEDISTKDSTGMAKQNTMKSQSWNGSVDALVINETDQTGETMKELLAQVLTCGIAVLKYTETSGDQNRTQESDSQLAATGNAILNDFTLKATNGEEISLSCKFTGWGPLTKNIGD